MRGDLALDPVVDVAQQDLRRRRVEAGCSQARGDGSVRFAERRPGPLELDQGVAVIEEDAGDGPAVE